MSMSSSSSTETAVLFCLIMGQSEAFSVEPAPDVTIHRLKTIIRDEGFGPSNTAVLPKDLVLWKVELDFDSCKKPLEQLDILDFEGSEQTKPHKAISHYWQPSISNKLRVFVSLSGPKEGRKRPRVSFGSDLSYTSDPKSINVTGLPATTHHFSTRPPLEIETLWQDCWIQCQLPIEQRMVSRDGTCPEENVPLTCWILNVQPWINQLLPTRVSGFMIREEYMHVTKAAIEFYLERTPLPDQKSYNSEDLHPPTNPFSRLEIDSSNAWNVEETCGFILISHPGIGKTAWLHVLLVWRLHAGLPTIYQSQPKVMFYFSADGVYRFNVESGPEFTQFTDAFPKSTWVLIDSNAELLGVPPLITKLQLFIVQSTSPRAPRIEWKDKFYHKLFYMAPWSLHEIIAGREFQQNRPSESSLKDFYHKYVPSARTAYLFAAKHLEYEDTFWSKLAQMTCSSLETAYRSSESLTSNEISHQLFLISPSQERPSIPMVSIPTRHLYELIRNHIDANKFDGAVQLYDLFRKFPRSMASAGYALGDIMHDVLARGGRWDLLKMCSKIHSKYTHWKPVQGEKSCLVLGYEQATVIISDTPLDESISRSLTMITFRPNLHTLQDGYYYPENPNQDTIDSFIYETSCQRATLFQAAVTTNTHSFNGKVIERLQKLGVKKFIYVAVTPPETKPTISVPNQFFNEIRDVYQLPFRFDSDIFRKRRVL